MKTHIILCIVTFMVACTLFISCKSSQSTANLTIHTVFQQDSYIMVNGEMPPAHVSEKETHKVKAGDKLLDFVVEKVTETEVKIRFDMMEYFEPTTDTRGHVFTLKRGNSFELIDMGILDASRKICIDVE